ncbi:hypothetical protein CO172_00200 [Candidatus Uhrbacteria bacterium CG_4_9_14_3_um_filter_36_7]|uniref:POTRA domain-containing protein n=1 Tax=Candidatus Uhrbacteria bacterium CG_4_9_14_3_um_filter_36_7 TaxID=1975033 RepID=A0A2M7XIF6_9BACT|nr:MAG: hypothetical protein CO172_00200 [Candidatus Uhrbacteria bacterium CG_4_9_14_3_um_filter_36_7]
MFFSKKTWRKTYFQKIQTRRYASRQFSNPYFPKKSSQKRWIYTMIGLILGFSFGLGSFFLTSPFFKITSVSITGIQTIDLSELKYLVQTYLSKPQWIIASQSNRFLFKKEHLEKYITSVFIFDDLLITREGNTLYISIKEKTLGFVLENQNNFFVMDKTGRVVRSIQAEEYQKLIRPLEQEGPTKNDSPLIARKALPRLVQVGGKMPKIDQNFLPEEETKNILKMDEMLQNLGFPVLFMEINLDVGTWLTAILKDQFDILFDPSGDINQQVLHLKTVLRERTSILNTLEYIDLRFDDHVYYK